MKLINSAYVPPPAAELPEELAISSGLQKWRFNPQGISLKRIGRHWEYAWSDVRWLAIARADEKRRDFNHLRLELLDRELELKYVTHQGGRSPTWSGATAEVVGETLRKYVDPNRVEILLPETRPQRLGALLNEYEKLQHERRQAVRVFAVMGLLLFAAIVWLGIGRGWLPALVTGFGYGSLFAVGIWIVRKRLSDQLLQLEAWIDEVNRGEDQI